MTYSISLLCGIMMMVWIIHNSPATQWRTWGNNRFVVAVLGVVEAERVKQIHCWVFIAELCFSHWHWVLAVHHVRIRLQLHISFVHLCQRAWAVNNEWIQWHVISNDALAASLSVECGSVVRSVFGLVECWNELCRRRKKNVKKGPLVPPKMNINLNVFICENKDSSVVAHVAAVTNSDGIRLILICAKSSFSWPFVSSFAYGMCTSFSAVTWQPAIAHTPTHTHTRSWPSDLFRLWLWQCGTSTRRMKKTDAVQLRLLFYFNFKTEWLREPRSNYSAYVDVEGTMETNAFYYLLRTQQTFDDDNNNAQLYGTCRTALPLHETIFCAQRERARGWAIALGITPFVRTPHCDSS